MPSSRIFAPSLTRAKMQRSTISSAGTLRRTMAISRDAETISSSTTGSGMASRRPGSYRYQPAQVFGPNRPISQSRSAIASSPDTGLAQFLRQAEHGGEYVLAGLAAAHDLQQLHHVRRAEEMGADHVGGTAGEGGNPVQVEGRGIAGEDRAFLHHLVELSEDALL